jgi:hypothetical protein
MMHRWSYTCCVAIILAQCRPYGETPRRFVLTNIRSAKIRLVFLIVVGVALVSLRLVTLRFGIMRFIECYVIRIANFTDCGTTLHWLLSTISTSRGA